MKILASIRRWQAGSLSAGVLLAGLMFCRSAAAIDPAPAAPQGKREFTADHHLFESLKNRFRSGDEVTRACLQCHNQASEQIKRTHHWQWHVDGEENFGKGGLVVNNFCISSKKLGDKSCLDCHIGWNAKEGEINCLVCHSQKEMNWNESFEDIAKLSKETDQSSREIVEGIDNDLHESITAIGQPGAANCGSCHFYSGGGDAVKRGDLTTSLVDPSREMDVHLSKAGAGLSCRDCHNTQNHEIPGRQYKISAKEERKKLGEKEFESFLRCEACHTETPHADSTLNDHFKVLACQTCHIPLIARQDSTKVWWDWSKAGQLKDGKPFETKDSSGRKDYMSIKGEFRWEKNIVPYYAWYDGSMKNFLLTDPLPAEGVVDLQKPVGEPGQKGAKIFPFKVHLAKQPYDPKLKKLLAPMLSGPEGYWTTLSWPIALKAGMAAMGLPFSGDYDFIETRFMYPVHHMIPPKEIVLNCDDCHTRAEGASSSRMAGVPGIYVAGRGDLIWLTRIAWIVVTIVVVLSILHGILRFILKLRKG